MMDLFLKKRKGFSLIETVASVVILSFVMVGMVRMATLKLDTSNRIDTQYSMVAVDNFLSDIYHSFHESVAIDYQEGAVTRTLAFTRPDGTTVIYTYDSKDNACFRNGIRQFSASDFDVTKTSNSLTVVVTLPGDRIFDINIYK